MSVSLYNTNQLRFWTEKEIAIRDGLIPRLYHAVRTPLVTLNPAWVFERVEGPLLTPQSSISSAYVENDMWATNESIGEEKAFLRAETTASSYAYARHLSQTGQHDCSSLR